MYIIFLTVLLIFFLMPVVDALKEKKKPKEVNVVLTEKMRCKQHLQSIAYLWGGIFVVLIMCLIGKISLQDIGLRQINFQNNHWFTVTVLVLCGFACMFFLYQTFLPLVSEKQRAEAKKQLVDDKRAGAVNMLPRTKKEKWLFSLLSLSAGVCEEILYRGFMVFLLQGILPDVPIYLIALISVVIFGLGHFYQGMQGIITTGVFGAVLMCLFLVTGSLIPGIVLHFLADFSSTFLLWEEQR